MKRFFLFAALIFALLPSAKALAQGNHEYAPLQEQMVNYKDWTLNNVADGKPVNLRSFVQGKKLVLVVYFAPWCPNWRNEAPLAAQLYEKYKANGLEVIGVHEYAALDETRKFFGAAGAPYMVVAESEGREWRDKTAHYGYRKTTGDTRNWGSPWNIFLEPAKFNKKGDVLTEMAWIVNGELIEADVEKFVRERLGLEAKAEPNKKAQLNLKIETDQDKLVRESLSANPNSKASKTTTPCKQ
ncbi:MAG: redoxin domain-containing protein [Pyrinomonadaceae bacterium]|nr:redoxin domain-containing protein [Pyrinomonadaceae bacterium]